MKILVPIKRVIDPNVKVRVQADHSGVDLNNLKMAINPFCEIAVEEAVRLKEQGQASEIIVVTIGDNSSQEQLRTALALGADRALLIETVLDSNQPLEPLNIAKLLKTIVDQEQPDLILLGKQSVDGDNNQTGQMLAALCGYPQATFASELTITDQSAQVVREVDGGLQTLKLKLPAVVTTDLRLNEPRFASLPNIMKAKRKPLEVISAASIGVELKAHSEVLEVTPPTERQSGVQVASVTELVEKLQQEAKVI